MRRKEIVSSWCTWTGERLDTSKGWRAGNPSSLQAVCVALCQCWCVWPRGNNHSTGCYWLLALMLCGSGLFSSPLGGTIGTRICTVSQYQCVGTRYPRWSLHYNAGDNLCHSIWVQSLFLNILGQWLSRSTTHQAGPQFQGLGLCPIIDLALHFNKGKRNVWHNISTKVFATIPGWSLCQGISAEEPPNWVVFVATQQSFSPVMSQRCESESLRN